VYNCDHSYDEDGICYECGDCYTNEIEQLKRERNAWQGLAGVRWQVIKRLEEEKKALEYQLTELEGPEQ
jgi:hypothetical protein